MSDTYTGSDPSHSRNWRGNYFTWQAAARRYEFPVTVRRIGEQKQPTETENR